MNRMKSLSRKAVYATLSFPLAALLIAGDATGCRAGNSGRSITVGRIDSMPVRAEKLLRPLTAHLAARLGDAGFDSARSAVAEGIPSMEGHLNRGTVDIMAAGFSPAATGHGHHSRSVQFETLAPSASSGRRFLGQLIFLGARAGPV